MSFTDSPFVTEAVGETPGRIAAQFATSSTPSTRVASFDDGRSTHNGDVWYHVQVGSIKGQLIGGGIYSDDFDPEQAQGSSVTLEGNVHIYLDGGDATSGSPTLGEYGHLPTAVVGGSYVSSNADTPYSTFTTTSDVYITAERVEAHTQIVGANVIDYSYGAHAVGRGDSTVNFIGDTHIRVDGTALTGGVDWKENYFASLEASTPGYKTPVVITGSHFISEESDAMEGDARLQANHEGNTYIDIALPSGSAETSIPLTQSVLGSMFVAALSTDTTHTGDTHVNIDLGGAGFANIKSYWEREVDDLDSIRPNFYDEKRVLIGGGMYTGRPAPRSAGGDGVIYNQHIIDGNTNISISNVGSIWSSSSDDPVYFAGGSVVITGDAFSSEGNVVGVANKCTITGKSSLTIDNMNEEDALGQGKGVLIVAGGHIVETQKTGAAENSIMGGTSLSINDTNKFGASVSDPAAYIDSLQDFLKSKSGSYSWNYKYDSSLSGRENLINYIEHDTGVVVDPEASDKMLIQKYYYEKEEVLYTQNVVTGGSYITSDMSLTENSTIGDISVSLSDDDLSNGNSTFHRVYGGSYLTVESSGIEKSAAGSTYAINQGNVNVNLMAGADATFIYAAGRDGGGRITTESTSINVESAFGRNDAYGIWSGDVEEEIRKGRDSEWNTIYFDASSKSSTVTGDRTLSFTFGEGTDLRGRSSDFQFINFDVVDVKHAAASVDFSAQDLDQLNGRSVLADGETRVSGLENAYGADTNTVRKTGAGSLILGATNGQQKGGSLQLVVEQGRVVLARDSAATTQSNFQTLAVQKGAILDMRAGHYDSVTGKYSSGQAGINGDLRLEVGAILQADASRDMTGSGTTLEGGSLSILGEGQVTLQFSNLDLVETNQVAEAGHLLFAEGSSYFEIVLFSGLDYASAESTNLLFELTGGTFDGVAAMGDLASKYFDANFILDDVYVVYNENGDVVLTGNELVIPEPSSTTLSLLSLAGLMARRRRRRA